MPNRLPLAAFVSLLTFCMLAPLSLQGQVSDPDRVTFLTAEWDRERFPDGRPKVPDDILERMKNVSIEEAWKGSKGSDRAC